MIQRNMLDDHLKDLCPKRPAICPYNCGDKDIWAEELEEHMNSRCPFRPTYCQLGCETAGIHVSNEEYHRLNECPLRLLQCSCGLNIKSMDWDEHQQIFCNDRLIYCTLGCGEKMKEEFMANHVEFFCVNKNYKYQKYIDCPNRCGETMMRRDVLEHVSYHCVKRMTECSLKCGVVLRFERLKGIIFLFTLIL
jgi:hypothetical protein